MLFTGIMSHTVITTTTTTRTSGESGLNLGYTQTIPGLLKIGQLVRVGPVDKPRGFTRFYPGLCAPGFLKI